MGLTRPQLDALVALLSESLRTRAGELLTDLVIADRARNAAQLLNGCYEMRPLPVPHRWDEPVERGARRHCVDCGVGDYFSARSGADGGCRPREEV